RARNGGHVVDQRAVDLVADGGDHRHRREGDSPAQRLVTERPEVGDAAAAACDDDDLDLSHRGKVANCGSDGRGRAAILNGRVAPYDRAAPGAALEPGEEIAPGGAA